MNMIAKIAWRNVQNNRWRSILTVGGIAVAVGMVVWQNNMMDAFTNQMITGATALDVGEVRIVTKNYSEKESLFEHFETNDNFFEQIQELEGVSGVTPRIAAYGLVGNEQRSQVSSVVGIDPLREARTTPLHNAIIEGNWLSEDSREFPAPREVVIGQDFAAQLDVNIGDELVVFVQASDGSLGNDLLEIVGIIHSGSLYFDREAVLMHIDDAAYLFALENEAHEVLISLAKGVDPDDVKIQLGHIFAEKTQEESLQIQTWDEAVPDVARIIDSSSISISVMAFIFYLITGLGMFNVQRMSALERTREFGVLQAIGLRGRILIAIIIVESLILGIIGGLFGGISGGLLSWYHSINGFNMAALAGVEGGFSFMGTAFSEKLYFNVTWARILKPFFMITFVAFLCGLIPALSAVRVKSIEALSGRQ